MDIVGEVYVTSEAADKTRILITVFIVGPHPLMFLFHAIHAYNE
jgi:hypothetical protein